VRPVVAFPFGVETLPIPIQNQLLRRLQLAIPNPSRVDGPVRQSVLDVESASLANVEIPIPRRAFRTIAAYPLL
jgi:hypothetical protein